LPFTASRLMSLRFRSPGLRATPSQQYRYRRLASSLDAPGAQIVRAIAHASACAPCRIWFYGCTIEVRESSMASATRLLMIVGLVMASTAAQAQQTPQAPQAPQAPPTQAPPTQQPRPATPQRRATPRPTLAQVIV